MRIVVALGHLGSTLEASWFAPEEFTGLWSVVLPEDQQVPMRSIIDAALTRAPAAEQREQGWWLADIASSRDSIKVSPREPGPAYGIDAAGRLLMDYGYSRLTIAEYLRAVDEGYYGSRCHDVVIVPPPEVGGNGFIGLTLVEWFAHAAPGVLLGYLGEKSGDYVLTAKDRRLKRLAADWAAQRIESPFQLRTWIDKRGEWFPAVLAERLSLSEQAAEQLLHHLGYEKNTRGLMQRRNSPESLERRIEWLSAEHGEFLESFDESGWEAGLLNEEVPTDGRWERLAGRLRRWLRRR